ncbi:helix-turn-helix domain-containing protein [Aeromonas phage BUCT552]|nr:helix-turn-helix domain-containing protein [Aeromonas phage BUCT552]
MELEKLPLEQRVEQMKHTRLRPKDAAALFRVTRQALYKWMKDPDMAFPRPQKVNKNYAFWIEYDLRTWAETKGIDLTGPTK